MPTLTDMLQSTFSERYIQVVMLLDLLDLSAVFSWADHEILVDRLQQL